MAGALPTMSGVVVGNGGRSGISQNDHIREFGGLLTFGPYGKALVTWPACQASESGGSCVLLLDRVEHLFQVVWMYTLT